MTRFLRQSVSIPPSSTPSSPPSTVERNVDDLIRESQTGLSRAWQEWNDWTSGNLTFLGNKNNCRDDPNTCNEVVDTAILLGVCPDTIGDDITNGRRQEVGARKIMEEANSRCFNDPCLAMCRNRDNYDSNNVRGLECPATHAMRTHGSAPKCPN